MGFDVFNALDLMDNKHFLEKLKFGVGDGFLQYYLYNWKCPSMEANQVRSSLFFLQDSFVIQFQDIFFWEGKDAIPNYTILCAKNPCSA